MLSSSYLGNDSLIGQVPWKYLRRRRRRRRLDAILLQRRRGFIRTSMHAKTETGYREVNGLNESLFCDFASENFSDDIVWVQVLGCLRIFKRWVTTFSWHIRKFHCKRTSHDRRPSIRVADRNLSDHRYDDGYWWFLWFVIITLSNRMR